MTSWQQDLLLIAASTIAGAINSVAGGGTLLTFPALLAAGQISTVANATNTAALWPGQLSSLWGYRREIEHNAKALLPLLTIGLFGGIAGAVLLTRTPARVFDHVVPFLVLLATLLFMAQEPLARWQRARAEALAASRPEAEVADAAATTDNTSLRLTPAIALFLLGVAVYGGYFGAGIGILTLAAFGLMGMTNIHQMNGIKNVFTLGINGIAAVLFMAKGLVDWRMAGIMAIGSIFGGYAGAGIARRIGQKNVRRIVIAIGLILTLSLLYRR
jgi:uncharacterized membrane protein YfcA